MSLGPFYQGETFRFQITLKIDAVAQDVSSDTVTFRVKKSAADLDSAALIDATADVTTSGSSGIAIFEVPPQATKRVPPGTYVCDIVWALDTSSSTRVFVAYSGTVECRQRVSDA